MDNRRRWVGVTAALLVAFCALFAAWGVATPVSAEELATTESASTDADVEIERVSLNIGSDETERNLSWQMTSDAEAYAQIVVAPEDWEEGDAFPADDAQTVTATCKGAYPDEEYRAGWYTFQATLSDLSSSTTYLYRVGNDECWSDTYQFTTGSLGDGESFSFFVAGDPQIGAGSIDTDTEGWVNTVQTALAAFSDTDFMISLGDQINTSDATTTEAEYDGFFASEELTSLALATNVGNHEAYSGIAHYSYNYNMPNTTEYGEVESTGDASGDYWYVYNGVLFMSLNSNDTNTAEHKAFLEEAIAANPDVTWKIVTFHHSIYSTASHTDDEDILQRRSELPQIFSDLGIDVVLMGHDHVYTRSYLMDGTTPVTGLEGDETGVYANPEDGQVLYVTCNSASGSKYYAIQDQYEYPFAAVMDQSQRETLTRVEVSANEITISTYFTDDDQITEDDLLDQVTIQRTDDAGTGTGSDVEDSCPSEAFSDLDTTAWYHEAVDWALETGAMNGYADGSGTFGPADTLTREQAAMVMWNLLANGDESAAATSIPDVVQGEWYATAVNWVVEQGIIKGYSDGASFGVGDALTREQFALIIARVAGADLESVDVSALDGLAGADEVSDWALKAVAWAVDAGVISGEVLEDGTRYLAPTREITRAEMAEMLMNAVEAGVLDL